MNDLRRRAGVCYGAFLLIAPFLLFWQIWWPFDGVQYGFALGDFSEQHVAMRTFVVSELRSARLPFWDPYTFAGEPAVADSLFSTYYPPSLWQLLFPPTWMYWVLQVEALWHAGLAGLFTFLAVRRLTGSAQAGFLSGLAFGISGYLTSYPMLQIIILQTAVWLPAAVWALEVAFQDRSWPHVVLAGFFLGWAILAGHPQTFLYVAYTLAAYLLWRTWRLRLPWHVTGRVALLLAGLGLGVSAAQWMPSLQMLPFSPHANVDYAYISNGFRLEELRGLFWPNAGVWSPLYVGLPALMLALWALVAGPRANTGFWATVGFVALMLAMGRYGFLFPRVYRWWPGLALFREQERWALVTVFALAILAGYGYAACVQRWPRLRRAFWGLALLLFFDLFRANSGVILEPVSPQGPFVPSPIVQHVRTVSGPAWRMSSEGLLPGGANAGLVFHVRDVVGSGPLYQEALDDFVATVPEIRWWQMLNVQHVLTRRNLTHGGLLHVMSEGDKHLYQTFIGARTAWIVYEYRVVPSRAAAIQATAQPDLDPFRTAILEEEPTWPVGRGEKAPNPAGVEEPLEERMTLVAFEHQRVAFRVTVPRRGIFVVSEMWYPGWQVYVDGVRARPLRAYGILRGVALPPGEHTVEWRFEPTIMWTGVGISSMTTLVGAGLWVGLRRQKRAVRS